MVVVSLRDASLLPDLLTLRAASAECLIRGEGGLAVDISAVRRLSSETIAALLWVRRICSANGIDLAVVGARSGPAQALHRCGLPVSNGTEGTPWSPR